jgi:hypothetical protein
VFVPDIINRHFQSRFMRIQSLFPFGFDADDFGPVWIGFKFRFSDSFFLVIARSFV